LAFDLIWNEGVLKDLKSLDHRTARSLIDSVKNRLAGNPLGLGKPLKGIFKGLYRYRHGDYRVIFALDRADKKVIILHIRHRSEAYRER
jgi:mRNA interferase RelE/StbE